jgi:hypothetical protein
MTRRLRFAPSSRLFRALVFVAIAATPAVAQLVGVRILPGAQNKYKGLLRPRGDGLWLVGDPVDGITFDVNTGKTDVVHPKFVVLCVADPAKPDAPLYEGRDKDGARKPVSDRKKIVDKKDLDMHTLWDKVQNLSGLREEYVRKRDEIEGKRKELGATKLGTPEWFEIQRKLLVDVDGLVFDPAADTWERQYRTELKKAGSAASKTRLEDAKRIVKEEVPGAVIERTRDGGQGDLKWFVKRSKNIRILAHGGIPEAAVDEALTTGERILEAFRTDFIDPDLGAEDVDPIPTDTWMEFMFAPEKDEFRAHLWEKYYGNTIGEPRERRIKLNQRGRRSDGFVSLSSHDKAADLDAYVAHNVGHFVAQTAFNGMADLPAWLDEGFAYWVSFEHLSRNTVTCFAFSLPSYARAAEKEGQKTVELGLRAAFNSVALQSGPSMSALMQTPLASMEGPHLAKAWSVVDWLVTERRKMLTPFLKAVAAASGNDRTNIEKLRPTAMEMFGATSGDVFVAIDEEWKKFAMKSGGESLRKKS